MFLTTDPKTGILYRENTFDKWILNESRGYFPLGLNSHDKVLDIGGHIGCFASRVKLEKEVPVVSVEPESSNYEVLLANSKKFNFMSMRFAVTADDKHGKEIQLYVNPLKNNALHSLVPVRGRPTQNIDAFGFNILLFRYEPTIIKCDIEGGEYDLPWLSLERWPQIRMVIMELHLTHKGHRVKAKEMLDLFYSMRFELKGRKPHIGEKNWTTLTKWER